MRSARNRVSLAPPLPPHCPGPISATGAKSTLVWTAKNSILRRVTFVQQALHVASAGGIYIDKLTCARGERAP